MLRNIFLSESSMIPERHGACLSAGGCREVAPGLGVVCLRHLGGSVAQAGAGTAINTPRLHGGDFQSATWDLCHLLIMELLAHCPYFFLLVDGNPQFQNYPVWHEPENLFDKRAPPTSLTFWMSEGPVVGQRLDNDFWFGTGATPLNNIGVQGHSLGEGEAGMA